MALLGVGYATPYLGVFREEVERTFAFMPATQGVVKWPSAAPSLAALVHETLLPLQDASVDRVLAIHALEMSVHAPDMLSEVWRVLAAGGRVLIVVPNRRGLWARMDTTPFGYGRPFSRAQLTQLLREALLTPVGLGRSPVGPAVRALHIPAHGGGMGARRHNVVAAVRRRAHRGSDKAGLAACDGAANTRDQPCPCAGYGRARRDLISVFARNATAGTLACSPKIFQNHHGACQRTRPAPAVECDGAVHARVHLAHRFDEVADRAEVDVGRLVPAVAADCP